MTRPPEVPRRIEVGDCIRSPEFVRGYQGVPGHPDITYVGVAAKSAEKYRKDDAERGAAVYTVTAAKEESEEIGGFLIRGLTTRRWLVEATRTCPDGTTETIHFTQFCTTLFGAPDYGCLIPVVEFLDETERKASEPPRAGVRPGPTPWGSSYSGY